MPRQTDRSSKATGKAPKKIHHFTVRGPALEPFTLRASYVALAKDVWVQSLDKVRWYQLPIEQQYTHPSGVQYIRCRVEAFDSNKNSLGFLPLPLRYRDAWVQLCYTIVHTFCEWKAWLECKPSHHKIRGLSRELIEEVAQQNGARLLHYFTIRRKITEELLSHKMQADGKDHLDVFDEFLIRDAKGWLWKEFKELTINERVWMKADPVSVHNARYFDSRVREQVAPEFIPREHDYSWIYGDITHYDFKDSWKSRLRSVVTYYNSVDLWNATVELTVDSKFKKYPDVWLEGQAPAIRFLTAEEDRNFNHPQRINPSSAPRAPLNGAADLRLDCPEARGLLEAFADPSRKVEIPETHQGLEQLFGQRYDASFWSKVLDTIAFNESGHPRLEEGWALVLAAQRGANVAPPAKPGPSRVNSGADANQPAAHASASAMAQPGALKAGVHNNPPNLGAIANVAARAQQPAAISPPDPPREATSQVGNRGQSSNSRSLAADVAGRAQHSTSVSQPIPPGQVASQVGTHEEGSNPGPLVGNAAATAHPQTVAWLPVQPVGNTALAPITPQVPTTLPASIQPQVAAPHAPSAPPGIQTAPGATGLGESGLEVNPQLQDYMQEFLALDEDMI